MRQHKAGFKSNNFLHIEYSKMENIFFYLYAIFITLPLLFRGGYFEKEVTPILLGLNIIFILWLIIKSSDKNFRVFNNPIHVLFSGIIILYFLSIFYGVNKRQSLIEFSRYFGYFVFIVMGFDLTKNKKIEKKLLVAIVAGGVLVSIIGIGAAIGTWEYTGAITGTRLSSTFQYPNTLASYVAGIYFLALTLVIKEDKKINKGIYGIATGTLIFTLILTYSRAMWLMFPISALLLFTFMPNERKLETVFYIIGSVIISIPCSFIFSRGMTEPSAKLWAIYIVASFGTGLLTYTISIFDNKYRQISLKKLIVALCLLFALVAMLGVYAINSTTEIILSNNSTENKWTTLNRSVSNLEISKIYNLQLSYTGENADKVSYLGRVVLYNVKEDGSQVQLLVENFIEAGSNDLSIPFHTPEDSIGIRVLFQNVYPNTSFTVKSSSIVDANSGEIIKDIPLKYKYIPENIVSRINSIDAGDSSLTARLLFFKDGLKIVKNHFFMGTGGGGWTDLYQMYQSSPYNSNLAHNYFLQLWIEIGTLGLIILLMMFIILIVFTYKSYRKSTDKDNSTLLVGLSTTIFTLLMHAFVDFDMSLAGFATIVWVVVGILTSNLDFSSIKLDKYNLSINNLKPKPQVYTTIIISILLVLQLSSMVIGSVYAQKAVNDNKEQDIVGVMKNFEKAVAFDSLDSTYKIDLSNLYMQLRSQTEDIEYTRKALNQVEDYIKLAPYNAQNNASAAGFYLSIGEFDKAMEYLDRSVSAQPMRTNSYINKLNAYITLYDYYLSKGKINKAQKTLEEALLVKEQIAKVNENKVKPMEENIDLVSKIGETQFFYENTKKINDIAERNLRIHFAYYFDVDINSDGSVDMLQISKPADSNIEYERIEEDGGYIRITNSGHVYGFVYPYGIKLEPNTEYVVEFNARGNTRPGTFRTYAWSNGSAEPNQGGLDSIPLTEEWGTYSFEFTSDADVNPGQQYMMLQHVGNDQGYIDLKNLIIYKSIN